MCYLPFCLLLIESIFRFDSSEPAICSCSIKTVILKLSPNSQESIWIGVSFCLLHPCPKSVILSRRRLGNRCFPLFSCNLRCVLCLYCSLVSVTKFYTWYLFYQLSFWPMFLDLLDPVSEGLNFLKVLTCYFLLDFLHRFLIKGSITSSLLDIHIAPSENFKPFFKNNQLLKLYFVSLFIGCIWFGIENRN